MMNQNIKRVFIIVVTTALVFPFVTIAALPPIPIHISEDKPSIPAKDKFSTPVKYIPISLKTKVKNTEEFCTKFTETANTIAGNISKQQTKALGFLTERKDASKEGRDIRDAELKDARDKADEKRNDWYKRLDNKADTDAKKNAVLQFKQTVDGAVDVRQTAVDTAIESFRKGVNDVLLVRDGSMQGTNDAFQIAVNTVVAKVKTDCDNGETTITIRSNFKTGLKNARDVLKTDKKNVDKVGSQVKALALTRQETVKKAVSQFQTTLKTAVADLKKAFGE